MHTKIEKESEQLLAPSLRLSSGCQNLLKSDSSTNAKRWPPPFSVKCGRSFFSGTAHITINTSAVNQKIVPSREKSLVEFAPFEPFSNKTSPSFGVYTTIVFFIPSQNRPDSLLLRRLLSSHVSRTKD